MRKTGILLLALLAAGSMYGQSLKRYPIGATGCAYYCFCDATPFNIDKSPDSSDVYTAECSNDGIAYSIICVKLKDKVDDLAVSEEVLIAYMDYLKTTAKVTKAAGYGKGHRLKNNENTRGVIDYWADANGVSYKVKGWTDGRYVAVLYVYSKQDIPETKANVFLDGLVLEGM